MLKLITLILFMASFMTLLKRKIIKKKEQSKRRNMAKTQKKNYHLPMSTDSH